MLVRHMTITAALLGVFAVGGTAMVAWTNLNTKERIEESERRDLLRKLTEVVPENGYAIDLQTDTVEVESKPLLGSAKPLSAYLARRDSAPAGVILTCIAPDGYSGEITLLVAIDYDTDSLLGVRVLAHHETPGLGDYIDIEKSNWINGFVGHSLDQPDELGWHVQKDGGIFDQVTGATITPRAVVKAVHNALKYYQLHKATLFDPSKFPHASDNRSEQ
jgi:electron transport complex protein RnfG